MLNELLESVNRISTHLAALSTAPPQQAPPPEVNAAPPAPPVAAAAEPQIPPPAKYSGNPNTCREFLTQIKLVFNAQPSRFQHEASKIAYVASLLEGPPLSYFNALHEQDSPDVQTFASLSAELKRIYDHPIRGQQAGQQLMRLRQSRRSVREFASEFRALAVESGWNEQALLTAFQTGLNRTIGREMALRKEQLSLDEAITTAIKISDQLAQWQAEPSPSGPTAPPVGGNGAIRPAESRYPLPPAESTGSLGEEPMQLGRARLTPDERLRRRKMGVCLYCGQPGHYLATCPTRPKEMAHQ